MFHSLNKHIHVQLLALPQSNPVNRNTFFYMLASTFYNALSLPTSNDLIVNNSQFKTTTITSHSVQKLSSGAPASHSSVICVGRPVFSSTILVKTRPVICNITLHLQTYQTIILVKPLLNHPCSGRPPDIRCHYLSLVG